MAADPSEGALALTSPAPWAYFLFILLATLRLDFWLCLFTGASCAVQYAALAIYFIGQSQGLDPVLTAPVEHGPKVDRKSTRLNSSHANISYAVFCLKKKNNTS